MTGPKSVFITGANRGIGLGLIKKYLNHGHSVIAASRNPDGARELWELEHQYGKRMRSVALDVTSDSDCEAVRKLLDGLPIDILINNAGVLPEGGVEFARASTDGMHRAFNVNVLGPMRVTQALLPNLKAGRAKTVATITSRMGSIADNTSGGHYAYRVSKAAVNMLMKSFALDHKDMITILLHPGWVQTEMGGSGAMITVQTAVDGLYHVIEAARHEQSGGFFDYNGQKLPW